MCIHVAVICIYIANCDGATMLMFTENSHLNIISHIYLIKHKKTILAKCLLTNIILKNASNSIKQILKYKRGLAVSICLR